MHTNEQSSLSWEGWLSLSMGSSVVITGTQKLGQGTTQSCCQALPNERGCCQLTQGLCYGQLALNRDLVPNGLRSTGSEAVDRIHYTQIKKQIKNSRRGQLKTSIGKGR